MFVGGIGYLINMGLYYPLTLSFKSGTTILGQQFYLPPFFISSFVAITCNYWMNKQWTFREDEARSHSYFRYLGTNALTVVLDSILLFLLVTYVKLNPELAAALAVLCVFIVRYFIAIKFIWKWKINPVKPSVKDEGDLTRSKLLGESGKTGDPTV
jgi:putative flippase GtrA